MLQRLRVCLPMQEVGVQSLVQGDSMCFGAARPMSHLDWAHVFCSPYSQIGEAAAVRGSMCCGWREPKHSSQDPVQHKY